MKLVKILAIIPTLVIGVSAFGDGNALPCQGQPRVLCSYALAKTQTLADWNFILFGTGQRQIFKGSLHTVEMNGTEHQGEAVGKTISTHPSISFQGKEDIDLKAKVSVSYEGPPGDTLTNYNPYKLKFSFYTIVDHFWGNDLLLSADQRIKVIPERLGTYRWTFLKLEARDVVTEYLEKSARLKHFKMSAVLPVTLDNLMEANIVPSADLDLVASIQAGTLQIGATAASLDTKGTFFASRWKKDKPFVINPERGKYIEVPNNELPSDCLKYTTAEVGYKAVTNIPVAKLAETAVKNVKVEVLKCYGEFKKEGDL